MPKTNLTCPNCNSRLVKTNISKTYQCPFSGDCYTKIGKHLVYSGIKNSPRFRIEQYLID